MDWGSMNRRYSLIDRQSSYYLFFLCLNSGTHEVQNFTVDQSISTTQVGLSWNFIDGSRSMGVLIIAYSLTDNTDIHYNVIPRPSGDATPRQSTTLSGLSGDRYNISVFALMENGLPFVRAVTEVKTVTVSAARQRSMATHMCIVMFPAVPSLSPTNNIILCTISRSQTLLSHPQTTYAQ